MATTLSDRQKEIVKSLFSNGTAQSVIQKVLTEQLSFSEIENVVNIIHREFSMHGLLPNYEPNEYGLELEALLNIVNRPRLARRAD
jgi:hypothetical protein